MPSSSQLETQLPAPEPLANRVAKVAKRKILFIGPLPGPITGQAVACQAFYDQLRLHHAIDVVNLSKEGFRQGVDSAGRVLEIAGVIWRVWRSSRSCDAVYFTISESYAGNAKDLLLYLVCFPKLPRTMIHLHGGAGMRVIMEDAHPLWSGLNRFFLQRLGAIVILGARHASIFKGVSPDRLHIVPNFADESLFLDTNAVQRKFKDARPVRLLFLSNLLPGKGHSELIDALALLKEPVRSRLQVDIAGGFESDAQKEAFLQRIRGLPGVVYHGTVVGERKRALFARAHVFCLPTYYPYEGQPISILEAYASGCAVITTDHSGILDVFTDEENGYCVEKSSAQSLANAIERMSGDLEAARGMALTNLRHARERYQREHYNKSLMRLLNELLPPPNAPSR